LTAIPPGISYGALPISPGLLPPPLQNPPWAFITEDLRRIRIDESIFHILHEPGVNPLPDEMAVSPTDNVDRIQGNTTPIRDEQSLAVRPMARRPVIL
jgi:hypothetical protein